MFISEASGKTLRVKDNGDVEGKGGEGTMGRPQSTKNHIYTEHHSIKKECRKLTAQMNCHLRWRISLAVKRAFH